MTSIPDRGAVSSDLQSLEDRNNGSFALQDSDWGGFRRTQRLAIYTIASICFIFGLSVSTDFSDNTTIYILNYSHLSIPILAVGLAVLPLRLAWYAFSVFFLCFLLAELVLVGMETSTGWTAFGMLKALPVALAVGFAGGAAAKSFHISGSERFLPRSPENSALIAGAVVALVGIPLAIMALWAETHGNADSEAFFSYAFVLAQRIERLALIAAAGILLLLALPTRKEFPELLLQIAAFVGVAIANRNGFELLDYADPALLGIALIFLRPIRPTLAAILIGVCVFSSLTGHYLELPSTFEPNQLKGEQTANLLFIVMVLVAALRLKTDRVENTTVSAAA